MTLTAYFKESSHRFYGAVVALFMLFSYEVLILWVPGTGSMIRNAPDAWLRTLLYYVGLSPHHITFVFITASLVAIALFYHRKNSFSFRIFLIIIPEAVVFGILSGFLIQFVMVKLFFMTGSITGSLMGDLGLAVGAGLFEELFFRVILTTFLIWGFARVLPVKWMAILLAILVASFLFSLSHYIGSAGDHFELYSFMFRFLAGIWFTALFSLRGFAVVSLSHAFYDIFVILI
ncbi:MAG: CPBP family glutamic-type intramembrane protease [Deltaproteobacteria bacterium]|nr:CPBP family glutamic-type intramembrane protease [Deltaproteobacteria bacterium]